MNTFRRIAARSAAAAAIGLTAVLGFQGVQASSGASGVVDNLGPGVPVTHAPLVHRTGTGFTHAYADTGDGTVCAGATADAIDVYSTSGGSPIQAFTTTAQQCHAYFGANTLAYVKTKKGPGCLVLADLNNEVAPGNWDSFSLNSDGTIKAQVSTVPDTYKSGSGTPDDVVAAGKGVVGTDASTNLIQLSVNQKSCKLGKPAVAADTGTLLNVVAFGTKALAANNTGNSVDTFTLKPFKLTTSTPSAVAAATDGIGTVGKVVATGSNQTSSQVQGTPSFPGTFTTASDPNGVQASSVGVDANCLWAINENAANKTPSTVSYFTNPGAPTFVGSVPIANGSYVGNDAQDVGGTFYMNDFIGGEIDASTIGGNCSITPKAWATMSDLQGHSSGLIFV